MDDVYRIHQVWQVHLLGWHTPPIVVVDLCHLHIRRFFVPPASRTRIFIISFDIGRADPSSAGRSTLSL